MKHRKRNSLKQIKDELETSKMSEDINPNPLFNT